MDDGRNSLGARIWDHRYRHGAVCGDGPCMELVLELEDHGGLEPTAEVRCQLPLPGGTLHLRAPQTPGETRQEARFLVPYARLPTCGVVPGCTAEIVDARGMQLGPRYGWNLVLLRSETRGREENALAALGAAAIAMVLQTRSLARSEVAVVRDRLVRRFGLGREGREALRQLLQQARARPPRLRELGTLVAARCNEADRAALFELLRDVSLAESPAVREADRRFALALGAALGLPEQRVEAYLRPLPERLAPAYQTLRLSAAVGWSEVREQYRRLMAQYHPDRFASADLPDEFRALAEERCKEFNAALAAIKESRGSR